MGDINNNGENTNAKSALLEIAEIYSDIYFAVLD